METEARVRRSKTMNERTGDASAASDDVEPTPVATSDTDDDRHERIARAAYRRAEQRGFAPGHEWEDWFAAEQEVGSDRPATQ